MHGPILCTGLDPFKTDGDAKGLIGLGNIRVFWGIRMLWSRPTWTTVRHQSTSSMVQVNIRLIAALRQSHTWD